MLKVCDTQYKLKKGRLSAELRDDITPVKPGQQRVMDRTWNIDLKFVPITSGGNWETEEAEAENGDNDDDDDYQFDGTYYEPRVYFECIPFTFRTWHALDGARYGWKKPFHDRPNGGFFMWEHSDIPRGSLELTKLGGAKFAVRWTGKADLYINDQYEKNVPFEISTIAEFEGVLLYVQESETRREVLRRFAEHFDCEDFVPRNIRRSGSGLSTMRFRPRL